VRVEPHHEPLNGGASTHRWACALLKRLTAALLTSYRRFTRSHAEQRRPRKEKRKGLTVALSSRGRRHLGLARCAAVGVSSHRLRRGVKIMERKNGARVPEPACAEVLFSWESRTAVRSELTAIVVQAKSWPMWARNTAGQDVIPAQAEDRPSVRVR
jgi:hypothetical protein